MITGGEKMNYVRQIGCCFLIDGEEYIYEGGSAAVTGFDCHSCGREIRGRVHLFNSSDGYNEGTYESRFYGPECVKKIIQNGYK